MRMTVDVELNLDMDGLKEKVLEANRLAMRDTVALITNDAVELSHWVTGNNRRSLAGEVSGMGVVAGTGGAERVVDDSEIEGAVYSTSGYGGYLETGTSRTRPRPYIKPALDMNFTQEKFAESVKKYLK